jgi:hypothetical protein
MRKENGVSGVKEILTAIHSRENILTVADISMPQAAALKTPFIRP